MFHHAHGMSLEGTKISYIKEKFATENTELLVLSYCSIQCENLVQEKGKTRHHLLLRRQGADGHPP